MQIIFCKVVQPIGWDSCPPGLSKSPLEQWNMAPASQVIRQSILDHNSGVERFGGVRIPFRTCLLDENPSLVTSRNPIVLELRGLTLFVPAMGYTDPISKQVESIGEALRG